jgi:acyl-coenzyme A thioesterase PaaI-like protein
VAEPWSKPLAPAREVPAPEGWTHAPQFDPFEAYLGPFFERWVEGAHEYALLLDDRHMNAAAVAHGGALMTFADAVLGYCVWDATDRSPCVTVSQQTNFLASAVFGELVWCRPVVIRKTREIVFTRGDFAVRERAVFTATSIWKVWAK